MKAGDYGFNKGLEMKRIYISVNWGKNCEYTLIFNVSRPRMIRLPLSTTLLPCPKTTRKEWPRTPIITPSQLHTSRVGEPSFAIQPVEGHWFPHKKAANQTALHVAGGYVENAWIDQQTRYEKIGLMPSEICVIYTLHWKVY